MTVVGITDILHALLGLWITTWLLRILEDCDLDSNSNDTYIAWVGTGLDWTDVAGVLDLEVSNGCWTWVSRFWDWQ